MRSLRLFTFALMLALGLSLPAAVSHAQTPTPTTTAAQETPSAYEQANWSKYMAFVLAGIGVIALGMAALGWVIQSPGFRKLEEEEE